MDRKWSALWAVGLCAGLIAAVGSAGGPPGVRLLRRTGELLAAAELGDPARGEAFLALLSGEDPPESLETMAETEPPGEPPEDDREDPPAGAGDLPEPTDPPETSPEESAAPEETPAPEALPEVRAFTEEALPELKNATSFEVDIPSLLSEPPAASLPAAGPQILIIHTHGTEAYLPAPGEEYEESDPFRTTDPDHSVIRVGDVLCESLEAWGLRVIHDRNLYDYPSYAGSYSRSAAATEAWLEKYPGIGVVIDVHRDAVGTAESVYKTLARAPGEALSQVMLVVGTGENGLAHPRWRENLKLALVLQQAMAREVPSLARPVRLAKERYNQHLTAGSLILEVGANGNTLAEAEGAAAAFGRIAGPVFLSLIREASPGSD